MLSCRECKNDAHAICFLKYLKPKMPENQGNSLRNIKVGDERVMTLKPVEVG